MPLKGYKQLSQPGGRPKYLINQRVGTVSPTGRETAPPSFFRNKPQRLSSNVATRYAPARQTSSHRRPAAPPKEPISYANNPNVSYTRQGSGFVTTVVDEGEPAVSFTPRPGGGFNTNVVDYGEQQPGEARSAYEARLARMGYVKGRDY